jgi:hypothetical protein
MDLIETGITNPIEHWYYKHKFWFIENSDLWKERDKNILIDIGAGSALFSKKLLQNQVIASAVAVDIGYSNYQEELRDGVVFRRNSDYRGYSHFLLTDVLEHIEDDYAFLKQIVDKSDPSSAFLITVPAFMSLWSGHDVYLKHFRRYSKKGLTHLIVDSGLRVVSVRYTYCTVFPLAFIQRRLLAKNTNISQLRENNAVVNWVVRILLFPDRYLNFLPFGVSIFLEAVKDA